MTKYEEQMIQGLLDWMGMEYEEKGKIPTVEDMYMYLLIGYDKVYEEEYLEELRMIFIES